MRVVIDTSGLVNAVPKRGSKKWLYNAFIWVFSNEILTEYDEIITWKFGPSVANYVISSLLTAHNHQRFEPSYKYQLVVDDPDDNKFLDCAIGANVDFLVTDDRHILRLRKIVNLFPSVPIVSFAQFKAILRTTTQ